MALGQPVELLSGGALADPTGRKVAHIRRTKGRLWLQGAMLDAGMAQVRTFADNRAMAAVMLEREAKAQRDLLESYLAKYREASARDSLGMTPAEARIISRAIVSNTPAFPKKVPIVLIATFATLFLSAGFITTGELLAAQRRGGGLTSVL